MQNTDDNRAVGVYLHAQGISDVEFIARKRGLPVKVARSGIIRELLRAEGARLGAPELGQQSIAGAARPPGGAEARRRRLAMAATQTAIATMAGVSRTTLANYETGRNIGVTPAAVARIMAALDAAEADARKGAA